MKIVTVYSTLTSLISGYRADTEMDTSGAAANVRTDQQQSDTMPPSVLCSRVSAKWMRQHRIGIEVRHSGQLAWVQSARIPTGRLIIHAESLSDTDLKTAVKLKAGHIVVSGPAHVAALQVGVDQRPQNVLLRATDDMSAPGGRLDGSEYVTAAHVIEDPMLRLAGLHADIGSRHGAFVSLPAAIGQMIADMVDIGVRHDVVLSHVSVGIEPGVGEIDFSGHAVDIQAALRDACRTSGFPMPATIVSTTTPSAGRTAA